MNIIRLLTFLIITMILVPIDSSAHCKPNHHIHGAHCDTPEPPDPGDGGGEDPTYSLTFNAPIPGDNGTDPWTGGNREVAFGQVFFDETTNLDLEFFTSLSGGPTCFADIPDNVNDGLHNPWFMQIFRGRRGRPEFWLWVEGQTFEDPPRPVTYRLISFGDPGVLSNNWLPKESGWNGKVTLTLTNWDMDLDNGQEDRLSVSCRGEGTMFSEDFLEWEIDVCLDSTPRTPESMTMPCDVPP